MGVLVLKEQLNNSIAEASASSSALDVDVVGLMAGEVISEFLILPAALPARGRDDLWEKWVGNAVELGALPTANNAPLLGG